MTRQHVPSTAALTYTKLLQLLVNLNLYYSYGRLVGQHQLKNLYSYIERLRGRLINMSLLAGSSDGWALGPLLWFEKTRTIVEREDFTGQGTKRNVLRRKGTSSWEIYLRLQPISISCQRRHQLCRNKVRDQQLRRLTTWTFEAAAEKRLLLPGRGGKYENFNAITASADSPDNHGSRSPGVFGKFGTVRA